MIKISHRLGFVEWLPGAENTVRDEAALTQASPGRLGQDFDLAISTERIIRAGQAGQSLGETYVLPALPSAGDGFDRVRYLTVSVTDASVRNADQADVFVAITDSVKKLQYNILNAAQFELVRSDLGDPKVLKMERRVPRSDFTPAAATGPFDVEILLSEEPAEFGPSHLDVTNGKVVSVVKGVRQGREELLDVRIANLSTNLSGTGDERALIATDFTGRGFAPADGLFSGTPLAPTSTAEMTTLARRSAAKLVSYLVTIEPDFKGDAVITVANFDGRDSVSPNVDRYITPSSVDLVEGIHKLTVEVGPNASSDALVAAVTAAYKVLDDGVFTASGNLKQLPAKAVIPAGGYLVLAKGRPTVTRYQVSLVHPVNSKRRRLQPHYSTILRMSSG